MSGRDFFSPALYYPLEGLWTAFKPQIKKISQSQLVLWRQCCGRAGGGVWIPAGWVLLCLAESPPPWDLISSYWWYYPCSVLFKRRIATELRVLCDLTIYQCNNSFLTFTNLQFNICTISIVDNIWQTSKHLNGFCSVVRIFISKGILKGIKPK